MTSFSVDIWFVFGSFVYGLEGQMIQYSERSIDVMLSGGAENERRELAEFFAELSENPKGLVKTEVRIFPAPDGTPRVAFTEGCEAISLVTQVVPQPIRGDSQGGDTPCLRLIELEGLSQPDQSGWSSLVRGIWPRS